MENYEIKILEEINKQIDLIQERIININDNKNDMNLENAVAYLNDAKDAISNVL